MEDCRVRLVIQEILSLLVVYLVLALPLPADTVEFVGRAEPIISLVGDDVILPCSLRSIVGTVSAVQETVEWQRLDLNPKEVHFYTDSRDSNLDQNPSYSGRTSLFKEELKYGNLSLKLSHVKISDSGSYNCYVPSLDRDQKASVQLTVGAVSQPVISTVGSKDYGVVLRCDSGGWYPEPEMIWLDSDGTNLPADVPPETETDSNGLHNVRGHLTVQKTDNNWFTCRVLQQKINHTMETQINVPDGSFPKSYGGLIAGIIIAVLVAVGAGCVGFFIWRKKNKEVSAKETRVVELDKHVGELVQITVNKEETEKQLKHQLEETETLLEQEKEKQKRLKAEQEELLKQQLEDQKKQQLEEQEKQQLEEQDAVQFLARHKDQIIKKINNHDAKVIAGELLKAGLVSVEENININKQNRMRMNGLYKVIESGGPEVKAGLYRSLMKHPPDLITELEKSATPASRSKGKTKST